MITSREIISPNRAILILAILVTLLKQNSSNCDFSDQQPIFSENGEISHLSGVTCNDIFDVQFEVYNEMQYINQNDIGFIRFYVSHLPNIPTLVFHEMPELQFIYLSNSEVETLEMGSFLGLRMLQELHLENNFITNIEVGTFNGLISLEVLNLSFNNLKAINENTFKGMKNLKKLYLKGNQIHTITNSSFLALQNIRTLALSSNNISLLDEAVFKGLFNLNDIDLSNNQIESLPTSIFKDLHNLNRLSLSSNKLKTLPNSVFSSLREIKWIDLSSNRLNMFYDATFQYRDRLNFLNVSKNEIKYLPVPLFKDLSQLGTLDLSCNFLKNITNGLLSPLGMLTMLDISHNQLYVFDFKPFFSLRSLKDLNLSYNKLTNIDADELITLIPAIQSVNLDGNNWTCNTLYNILKTFRTSNTLVKTGTTLDSENLHGIHCNSTSSYGENPLTVINKNISSETLALDGQLSIYLNHISNILMEMNEKTSTNSKLMEKISVATTNASNILKVLNNKIFQNKTFGLTETHVNDRNTTNVTKGFSMSPNTKLNTTENNLENFYQKLSDKIDLLQMKLNNQPEKYQENKIEKGYSNETYTDFIKNVTELIASFQTKTSINQNNNSSAVTFLSITVVLLILVLGFLSFKVMNLRKLRQRQLDSKSNINLVTNTEETNSF